MKSKIKTLCIWIVLILFMFVLLQVFNSGDKNITTDSYETFTTDLEANLVDGIRINQDEILVSAYGKPDYKVYGEIDQATYDLISMTGIPIEYGPEESPWYYSILINAIPLVILIALIIYFLSRTTNTTFNLRDSTAREINDDTGVRFGDVAGCTEAKDALKDVTDFLNEPKLWQEVGARLPRGILLEGPSGCGKTLLARAVAGETKAKFFEVSASEFVDMFVGVGASRVRGTFEEAKKEPPAVIFIDEIDTLGKRSGTGFSPGHDEREQTLNQLLVCMDGFQPNEQIVVIGATNRCDMLDPALMRPGRFDRKVHVPSFSDEDRKSAFEIHTKNKKLAEDVNFEEIDQHCNNYNGAEIEHLTNEAAMLAVRRIHTNGKDFKHEITQEDFMSALKIVDQEKGEFDTVDQTIIESVSRYAEPQGNTKVHVTLDPPEEFDCEIVWADNYFIKLMKTNGDPMIIPKFRVISMQALDGTEKLDRSDINFTNVRL